MRKSKGLNSYNKGVLQLVSCITEAAVFTLIYFVFWKLGYEERYFADFFISGNFILPFVFAVLSMVLLRNTRACLFGKIKTVNILINQAVCVLSLNAVFYILLCLMGNTLISPVFALISTFASGIYAIIHTAVFALITKALTPKMNMLLIYGTDNAVSLKIKLDALKSKYNITKLIPADKGIDYIENEIKSYDAVIINDLPGHIRNDILKLCYKNKVTVYMVPKITDIITRGADEINVVDTPLLLVNKGGLTDVQKFLKRAMDIVFCLLAMIVAAPLMLMIALAIKIEDGGPVFYKQKRATLGEKEFDILKFRSMIVDAEKDGRSIPATGLDPRITKVGRIIRPFRLDEVPQILNILKGDMSIVGPRPERLEHVYKYSEDIPEFVYRLNVKGGLTGYAQIYGKYNTSPYDKLRLDLFYIENYSLLLDIKLILLTVPVLFSKESTEGFDVAEEIERLKKEALESNSEADE